jgi:hypothetical protein
MKRLQVFMNGCYMMFHSFISKQHFLANMTFLLFVMAPSDVGFDSPYGLECLFTKVAWERGFVFMESLIVELKTSLRATLFVTDVTVERRLY